METRRVSINISTNSTRTCFYKIKFLSKSIKICMEISHRPKAILWVFFIIILFFENPQWAKLEDGALYCTGWSTYPYRFCFTQPGLGKSCGLPTFAPLELFARSQVRKFWNSLQGLTSCPSFIVTLPIQMNRTRISHTFCCNVSW